MAAYAVSTILFCNVNANRSDRKHITQTALHTQQVSLTDAEIKRVPLAHLFAVSWIKEPGEGSAQE